MSFIDLSRDLAWTLGDRTGRTTSRVIGQPISDMTGLTHWGGTQVGHAAMLVGAGATLAALTTSDEDKRTVAIATSLTILTGLGFMFLVGRE